MSAYNTESALARLVRPHYARDDDEARALLREAFPLSGDIQITGNTLHVRLDPARAPPTQQRPRRPMHRADRHRDPLPRHRPDPRLQHQGPP